jgi:capsular polysaccharide biosynthesis protein
MERAKDLREIGHIIKKRILLIAGITALFTIAASAISFYVLKPVYEAETSIIISKPITEVTTQTYNDVLMYQNLVKTYSEIAKSKSVANRASTKLNNKYSVLDIMKASTISPETSTQILNISVRNGSPQDAKAIAEALSTAFIEESAVVFPNGGLIEVMDEPELPQIPVAPNKKLNIAIGLFLGLMASGSLVFLLEYLDRSVKTEDDVAKYLKNVPVLGIIPKEAKK